MFLKPEKKSLGRNCVSDFYFKVLTVEYKSIEKGFTEKYSYEVQFYEIILLTITIQCTRDFASWQFLLQ